MMENQRQRLGDDDTFRILAFFRLSMRQTCSNTGSGGCGTTQVAPEPKHLDTGKGAEECHMAHTCCSHRVGENWWRVGWRRIQRSVCFMEIYSSEGICPPVVMSSCSDDVFSVRAESVGKDQQGQFFRHMRWTTRGRGCPCCKWFRDLDICLGDSSLRSHLPNQVGMIFLERLPRVERIASVRPPG
ncbi:hypothetical protein EDC04DRAFT_868125 [Pisolithus marmoratus]|nr:hypothetical protein EDC04DRAFT_868125 [Pisolithus marmoratus]